MAVSTFVPAHHQRLVVVALKEHIGITCCDTLQQQVGNLETGFRKGSIRHVVIDCNAATTFGGTALGILLRLWKTTQRHGGTFSMCGLSNPAIEVLQVVRLHQHWPLHPSLAEALAHHRQETAGSEHGRHL